MGCTLQNNEKSSRWRNWQRRERCALVETSVKVEGVQNYSVLYKGYSYNLIRVTTVERGDGSYDSTNLFLYVHKAAFIAENCTLYMYINKGHGAAVRR
jgi:hypothetical protein